MAGQASVDGGPKQPKRPKAAPDSKLAEQMKTKDRQLSALAGQLKQAGMKPDWAKARSRSQTPGPKSDKKSKGDGKGKR